MASRLNAKLMRCAGRCPGRDAVALLPPWARGMLCLTRMPGIEEVAVPPTGQALTRTIRWTMNPPRLSRPP